jgi:Fe-S-cluster containining protein
MAEGEVAVVELMGSLAAYYEADRDREQKAKDVAWRALWAAYARHRGKLTRCAGCGDCCQVIQTALRTDAWPDNDPSKAFVVEHWHQLGFEEAAERSPAVVRGAELGSKFYTCDQFNDETRACMAHEKRPWICRGFPGYGSVPTVLGLAPYTRCSYWHDLPREQWLDGIDPLPSEETAVD